MRVEARMFLGIAGFVAFITLVYGVFAREEAGTTMLLLTAGMGAVMGGYLVVQARRRVEPAADPRPAGDVHYLPHASVWPFAIGIGSVLVGNGFALGLWAVLPGAALLGYGLWGFARQSRRRD